MGKSVIYFTGPQVKKRKKKEQAKEGKKYFTFIVSWPNI